MASRKKTFILNQELIEEARRLSAARTETEVITQALEDLVGRHKFILALEEMARLGPFDANRI